MVVGASLRVYVKKHIDGETQRTAVGTASAYEVAAGALLPCITSSSASAQQLTIWCCSRQLNRNKL